MYQLKKLLFLFSIFSLYFSFAKEKLILNDQNQGVNIAPYLSFFKDTNSIYFLEDILKEKAFIQNIQKNPNIAYTKATIWGKFTIQNKTNKQWFLEVSEVILDSLIFYIPIENDKYIVQKAGLFVIDSNNYYQTNRYVYDLKVEPNSQKTYFFKVKSIRLQFPMNVLPFAKLIQKNHQHDLADGVYYGFVMIMFLYNLFLFFSTKDKNYLLYVLYLFTSGFYIFWIKGHFTEFISVDYLWLNKYGVTFSSLSGMTSIIFSVYFLELKKHLKNMFYTLMIMFYILIIPIVLNFMGYNLFASKITQLIIFFSFFIIIISAFFSYVKGYNFARFFIIGWIGFVGSVMIYILKTANILPLNVWTANSMQIGSSWEMLLLSLALADRINLYRQKIKASEKELQNLNQVLTSQNKRLQEYTYMVSHNLRGPVANLLGMIDLYDEINIQNSFNKEVIKHIKTASENLDTIVIDLNISIRTIENVNLEISSIILKDIISNIQENLQLQIQEIKPTITFDLKVPIIQSNKSYVESILFNIIQNSLKFKDKSRPLSIQISSNQMNYEGEYYDCISIVDNGIGIDLIKNKDHIFKFYYQGQKSADGRGIGLYLVSLQMETLGAKIQLSSTVNEGTSFMLLFPIIK